MRFNNSRLAFGFGVLSLAILTVLGGCTASEDGAGAGGDGSFTVQTEVEVLGITPPTAGAAGSIETRSYEYECMDDQLLTDTSDETSHYIITGGKMLQWGEGECVGLTLDGSSSTIVGKWTLDDGFKFDSVPAPYRGTACAGEEDEEDIEILDSLIQDVKISYDISETRIKGTMSGKICMGTLYAGLFASDEEEEEESLFELVSSTCGTATIKNNLNNRTLKISTRFSNDEVAMTYTSSGKSCTLKLPMDLSGGRPTCPEKDYTAQEDAFDNCVEKLAFFQMEGLDKRSSASSRSREILKRIQGSLRGL